MNAEPPCSTGRCGYGEPCRCEHYSEWISTPPSPTVRIIRSGGYTTGYRDGWRAGYAKGAHDAMTKKKEGNRVA